MAYFERIVNHTSRWCNWVAGGAAVAMVVLVCGNVVLRFFSRPILGTFEYVCFLAAVIISFALAYCSIQKGHVAVELIVRRFSERTQAIIDTATGILSLGTFGIITWQCGAFATRMWHLGLETETMEMPLFPVLYGLTFGFLVFLMTLLIDLFKSLAKAVKK